MEINDVFEFLFEYREYFIALLTGIFSLIALIVSLRARKSADPNVKENLEDLKQAMTVLIPAVSLLIDKKKGSNDEKKGDE